MATQTQTLNAQALRIERTYDFLYDPIYSVSGQRDHVRATVKAQTDSSKLKLQPIYRTMFSDLRHCPRYQLQYDPTDPVPKSIPRQWKGYAEQAREELLQHHTAIQASTGLKLSQPYGDENVSGKNRAKFFRRPIIPFLQQVPPDVILDISNQDPLAGGMVTGRQGQGRPMTPLVRTMFTQTDYRDSEAQTDPYTPEYVIRPGSAPELLTLATLSYGHGLPAGLAEVEMIERARAKRAWEAQLPPLNDMSQMDKRRRMMEDMERAEWALREQEIEKLQEARLEVLKKLLVQREERHQEMNTNRLDRLWSRKQEEKVGKLKLIRHEHLRMIRKLTKKCENVEGKYARRDIIDDFSNFQSQSYAPLTRIGVFIDKGSEQFVVKSRLLNTYEGLLELENTMPSYALNPRIKAPHPRNTSKAGHVLRKYRKEKELTEVHQVIKDRRVKTAEPDKPLRFLKKIERPAPRPPTPAVEVPSQEEENRELAVIFLQKLIRGRAIQNMMFEGKEKRIELIAEMRSTHALQEAEQQVKKEEKQMTLALQRQHRLFEHKESFVDEVLAEMEGTTLSDTLDFLSKELIRLQEERRIHAFCMLAERERRLREAAEAGKRQLEERRRREEDEIFKQVISVHQNTVDSYLEDVILNSIDSTADRQARQEIQEMAKRINDVAYDIENRRSQLESEEIVAELVHGFLLPEVQKETVRERVQRYQRHYLLAAHNEIHKTGEDLITTLTPRKYTLPVSPRIAVADFPAPSVIASAPNEVLTSKPSTSTEREPDLLHGDITNVRQGEIITRELEEEPSEMEPITTHEEENAEESTGNEADDLQDTSKPSERNIDTKQEDVAEYNEDNTVANEAENFDDDERQVPFGSSEQPTTDLDNETVAQASLFDEEEPLDTLEDDN